jgi:hypothetical protein
MSSTHKSLHRSPVRGARGGRLGGGQPRRPLTVSVLGGARAGLAWRGLGGFVRARGAPAHGRAARAFTLGAHLPVHCPLPPFVLIGHAASFTPY